MGMKRLRVTAGASSLPSRDVMPSFNLMELFDDVGCLRALRELPPAVAGEIRSFDIVRTTSRSERDTVHHPQRKRSTIEAALARLRRWS
jgi:hypothetical protein